MHACNTHGGACVCVSSNDYLIEQKKIDESLDFDVWIPLARMRTTIMRMRLLKVAGWRAMSTVMPCWL